MTTMNRNIKPKQQCSGTMDATGQKKEVAYSSQRAVNFSSLHDVT